MPKHVHSAENFRCVSFFVFRLWCADRPSVARQWRGFKKRTKNFVSSEISQKSLPCSEWGDLEGLNLRCIHKDWEEIIFPFHRQELLQNTSKGRVYWRPYRGKTKRAWDILQSRNRALYDSEHLRTRIRHHLEPPWRYWWILRGHLPGLFTADALLQCKMVRNINQQWCSCSTIEE